MEQRDPKLGFVTPAILDVSAVKNLPDEEHFGPLAQIIRYGSFNEALEKANDTEFGLSAGLLADDESLWTQFPAHHPRGHRQLEPADQRRVVGCAVRRAGAFGQSPAERLLRGRLLRVSDGVG